MVILFEFAASRQHSNHLYVIRIPDKLIQMTDAINHPYPPEQTGQERLKHMK